MSEWLGLTDPVVVVAGDVLDQGADPFERLAVLTLPPQVVLPGAFIRDKLHSARSRSTPSPACPLGDAAPLPVGASCAQEGTGPPGGWGSMRPSGAALNQATRGAPCADRERRSIAQAASRRRSRAR